MSVQEPPVWWRKAGFLIIPIWFAEQRDGSERMTAYPLVVVWWTVIFLAWQWGWL